MTCIKSGVRLKNRRQIKKWREEYNEQIRDFLGIVLFDTGQKSQNETRKKLHPLEGQCFKQVERRHSNLGSLSGQQWWGQITISLLVFNNLSKYQEAFVKLECCLFI